MRYVIHSVVASDGIGVDIATDSIAVTVIPYGEHGARLVWLAPLAPPSRPDTVMVRRAPPEPPPSVP